MGLEGAEKIYKYEWMFYRLYSSVWLHVHHVLNFM